MKTNKFYANNYKNSVILYIISLIGEILKMINKLKFLPLTLCICIILSSCMNIDFILNVDKLANCNVEVSINYKENNILIKNTLDKLLSSLNNDFNITQTNNGYLLKKEININNYSNNKMIILPISNYDYKTKDFFLFKKIYVNASFSIKELTSKFNNDLLSSIIENIPNNIYDKIKIRFILNIPLKIGNNNANLIKNNGKTAIWEIYLSKNNQIYLTQTIPNIHNIIIVFIIFLSLIILTILIFKANKYKKTHKSY